MPVKKILSIEVDDSQFRKFKDLFDRYNTAVAKLPQDWKKVAASVGAVNAVQIEAAAILEKKLGALGQKADAVRPKKDSIDAWGRVASSAGDISRAIDRSVATMAKWGSLATGVLGGLVGVGSLFGIERLAASIGATRTRAMGLGITYGQQKSYGLNYGRLVGSDNIMSNVSTAKYDIASDQYKALMAAGISQRDIQRKNSAQLFSQFMERLPEIFAHTPKGMIGTTAQQTGLNNIASTQDIVAYLNASPGERAKIEADAQKDAKNIDLQDSVQRQWQDFITQMGRATETIKSKFMDKVSILEPDLEALSKAVSGMVTKLVDSGTAKATINWLGVELNKFADYVGKKEFQDDIRDFSKWVGSAAKSIWNFVSFFGGVSPANAEGAASAGSLNAGGFSPGDSYDPTTGHVIRGGSTEPFTGSAGIPHYWNNDILSHAEDRLEKEAGLSPMGASALVARWTQEAPGGPSSVNGIGATGINQALGSRRPDGYAQWPLDKQLDYIINSDLKSKDQARALAALKSAQTAEDASLGAADYERAEGYSPGRGDVLSARTPVQKVYDATHHAKNVVIRNQSGANAPRSMFSVAQPYAPATAQ